MYPGHYTPGHLGLKRLMQRRAIITDAADILRVRNSAIRGLALSHYPQDEIESWCAARSVESYAREIEEKLVFVDERNGGIVAMAQLNHRTAFVEGLYVLPSFAGRGVGLGLMKFLEKTAAALGIKTLALDASLNAVPFYQRAGYVPVPPGAEHQAPAVGTIQMQRQIDNE